MAEKLKAAGFPQPEIEVGQFWYAEPEYKGGSLEHVPLCVVVEQSSTRNKYLRRLTCEKYTAEHGGKRQFFAPTATDILKEREDWLLAFYGGKYVVIEFDTRNKKSQYLENSADACAEAYLSYFSIS